VQRSIIEKEEGLKVAQTRLDERTRRRCVELCRDAPMHGSVVVVVVVVAWMRALDDAVLSCTVMHHVQVCISSSSSVFVILGDLGL